MANKFSDYTDDELGAMVRSRVADHNELQQSGHIDSTPGAVWNDWGRSIRRAKDARDSAASGELEENDQPQAGDDPGEFPGKPANPQRGKPAQDSALRGRTMTIDSALAERLDHGRARRACGLDYGVQYEDDGITVRSRPSGT